MRGAIPPLLSTPSWRKEEGQLYPLPFTLSKDSNYQILGMKCADGQVYVCVYIKYELILCTLKE